MTIDDVIDKLIKLKDKDGVPGNTPIIITCCKCNHSQAWVNGVMPTIVDNSKHETFGYIKVNILENH